VLLELEKPETYTIIRFDLPGAGAVNNHGSYRKLDAMMRELTEIAQKKFPGGFVVRANGGSFFLFAPGTAVASDVEIVTAEMNQMLEREAAQLPYARLESRQKSALRDMVRQGQESFAELSNSERSRAATEPYHYRSFLPATLIPQEFLVVGALLETLTLEPDECFYAVLERWNPRRR
jgi:GGDEF domain-containing protein